jgi:hypothetical protein
VSVDPKIALLSQNEEVLRAIVAQEGELDSPRCVGFELIFPEGIDDEGGAAVLQTLEDAGFDYALDDSGSPEFNAYKVIEITAEAITDAECELNDLLKVHNIQTNGWGFFEVDD